MNPELIERLRSVLTADGVPLRDDEWYAHTEHRDDGSLLIRLFGPQTVRQARGLIDEAGLDVTVETYQTDSLIIREVSPRTYTTGIPLAVTINPDGTITLDFDLAEVAQDMEPVDETPVDWNAGDPDQYVTLDADNVDRVLTRLRNHFALTLNA